MNLANYRAIVFDCDGVILDSNRLKTEAFRTVAEPIDPSLAEELVRYHVENGGISRYRKFDFFIRRCRERGVETPENGELCKRFGETIHQGMLECPVANGLHELRQATPGVPWIVASGGDQEELREIFRQRGIDDLFDAGIFGSPDTKHSILARAVRNGRCRLPALMLGDSREDYRAAVAAGLDFVFVSAWSEFSSVVEFSKTHRIPLVQRLSDLLE